MSQAQLPNELATFLENWTTDPNNAKDAFVRFKDFLLATPDVRFDFKARPGVSYSLRAANAKNDERPLFVLVDVVDDEPEARWLSVCFYADMVNDPDELGDFVPSGLMGKDACCLNLEEDDPAMRDYILARLGEVRTKEGEISELTEMHFDRDEFSVHVNVFDSCSNAELFQLVQLAGSNRTPEIGKINR